MCFGYKGTIPRTRFWLGRVELEGRRTLLLKFALISPKNRPIYNFRGDLLKEILSRGYQVIATGPNAEDIDKIKELGVGHRIIPLEKDSLNVTADLKYLWALRNLLKDEEVDATLAYTIKPVIYGAIAAKLAGVKNINSMVPGAGYVFTDVGGSKKAIKAVVSILYKIGFSCASTVIFQNKDDLREFVEHKLVNPEKCRLVDGSGVNMDKYRYCGLPNRITFFMLSRVRYTKGVMEYLEAARKIKDMYPETRFMLLGGIENTKDSVTEEIMAPYINDDTVEYYGETRDVVSFYRESSVFVLPSYYREGIPRVIMEAMAIGRPIITTDAPGCRETVIDGTNGFLVPIKDSDALFHKMEWFIKNPDQIEKMGQASYRLCKDRFDVDKVNGKMLEHMNIANN